MTNARSAAGVAVVDGLVYAIGGLDGNRRLKSVERFDPRRGAWESVAPMRFARSNIGAGTLGGELYAIGGCARLLPDFPGDRGRAWPLTRDAGRLRRGRRQRVQQRRGLLPAASDLGARAGAATCLPRAALRPSPKRAVKLCGARATAAMLVGAHEGRPLRPWSTIGVGTLRLRVLVRMSTLRPDVAPTGRQIDVSPGRRNRNVTRTWAPHVHAFALAPLVRALESTVSWECALDPRPLDQARALCKYRSPRREKRYACPASLGTDVTTIHPHSSSGVQCPPPCEKTPKCTPNEHIAPALSNP